MSGRSRISTARNRIAALVARRSWLEHRLADGARQGKRFSYSAAEIEALRWAIELCEREVIWFKAVAALEQENRRLPCPK